MSEVDKTSFPSTKCGSELIFDIRAPAKHQLNLIKPAHAHKYKHNQQQQQHSDYIPY
jgi:hypothetical protein